MKVCPKCTSLRMRRSHAHTASEVFYRERLGYRFYRCQQCNWRGKARPAQEQSASKVSRWKRRAIFAAAVILVLFIVVIGVGGTPPAPNQ